MSIPKLQTEPAPLTFTEQEQAAFRECLTDGIRGMGQAINGLVTMTLSLDEGHKILESALRRNSKERDDDIL